MHLGRVFAGLLLTLIAGGLWIYAVYFLKKGLPSLLWPRVMGRILGSTTEGDDDLACEGDLRILR